MLHRFIPIISLVAASFILLPLTTFGQQSDTDKFIRYQSEKKSELIGVLLESFIPLVGHAYAGNIRKGYAPGVVSLGGLALVVIGASIRSDCETFYETRICLTEGNSTLITVGFLTYLGGRAWGIISTLDTVKEFNSNLQRSLGITLNQVKPVINPSPQGVQVGLALNF